MAARVTVVTIFLDEERFLGEAIESVRSQTYEDWELLLVDDGSRDRSVEIAKAAAAADPSRVRYLRHPRGGNRGMSASRNLGVSQARGELIAFLDGDDVWLPGKLSEQVDVFDSEPGAGMVYGRVLIWHSWQRDAALEDYTYPLGVEPDRLYDPPALFPVLVRNRAQTPTTLAAMVRRSLVERLGGFEEHFHGMFEDQAFFAKVHLNAATWVDGRIWARYRQHEDSCSARAERAGTELVARRAFLDWLGRYLRAAGDVGFAAHLALLRARADWWRLRGRAAFRRRRG